MLYDQGHSARNDQQKGQPAETMVTVMMVVAMAMMPPSAAPSKGAGVRTAFVQREFIAHADIDFAHRIFPKVAAFMAAGRVSS